VSKKYFFRHYPKAIFSLIILPLFLAPVFIELILYQFLRHPSLLRHFPYLHTTVADIYYNRELDIIQYRTDCAKYDSTLLYILKTGQCHHRSIEFECNYSINSMGLRDDEISLQKPEIIILGDSYAMGWGMDNEKIFPSLLEKETGMNILNASVPSYGTAREFLLLDRLDRGNLKFLIIQHCLNDFKENREFIENGYRLKPHPPEFYKGMAERQMSRKKYFPFLYLSTFLKVNILQRFSGTEPVAEKPKRLKAARVSGILRNVNVRSHPEFGNADKAARDFLEIISHRTDIGQAQVIVLSVSGPAYDSPDFIRALSKIKSSESYPPVIRNMKLIDIYDYVEREDYFILDNHLNEQGHRKVADLVISAIKSD